MKIRYKISLWIAGAGLITSLLFSLSIFYEMVEQTYNTVDSGLKRVGKIVINSIEKSQTIKGIEEVLMLTDLDDLYWIKIYNHNKIMIYQSERSKDISLPLYHQKRKYTVRTSIQQNNLHVHESVLNKVSFRARILKTTLDGKLYTIQIATSLEELDEEILEVVLILIVGLTASALLLILISYFIAGKILEPIKTINRLTIEINERTLNKRIPLGKNHDEVYQLSQSLNRMFDRLQHSFIRQKQFIASASHELKTPISMLRMFMDNAISQQDHPEPFKQQLIDQEAILIRMERLVKTLLNLSAMELEEALEIKNFNLTKIIRTILHDFSPVIAANNIQLDVCLPDDVCMAGNQDKIRLMLINILDNAIKYNYENGIIKLVVSETGDTINISLYNTGPGIPSQDLDKIFEQFYRVEKSRSLQYGGTGLGLSIVKKIVSLHRGSIKMESKKGEWAKIEINLPAAGK